jgi:RNA polymerase sigma-70 factor (ECF subfamily)
LTDTEDLRRRFHEAAQPHAGLLCAYIKRRVPADDASDVAQEVMLALWKRALDGGIPPEREFVALMLAVARNKIADLYRARSGGFVRPAVDDEGEESMIFDMLPDGSDVCAQVSEAVDISDAIKRLSGRDRELVRLYYGAGLGFSEISEAVGMPVGTVKSRMSAIRSALRARLGDGYAN